MTHIAKPLVVDSKLFLLQKVYLKTLRHLYVYYNDFHLKRYQITNFNMSYNKVKE